MDKFIVISLLERGNKIVDLGVLLFNNDFTVTDEFTFESYNTEDKIKLLRELIKERGVLCWTDLNEVLLKYNLQLHNKIILGEWLKSNGVIKELEGNSVILRCREMYAILSQMTNMRIPLN